MTEPSVRRRRFLTTGLMVGVFLAGAVAGTVVTIVLADRASRDGLRVARALFAFAQDDQLALAWNAGDMNEALVHARCAYDAKFMKGAWWFGVSAIRLGSAAEALSSSPASEGMAHAKIAVVLERLGRADEARDQLAQAAKTIEKVNWRALGLKTVGRSSETIAKDYGLTGLSR